MPPQTIAQLTESQIHVPAFEMGAAVDIEAKPPAGIKGLHQRHPGQITTRQAPEKGGGRRGLADHVQPGVVHPFHRLLWQQGPDAKPQAQNHGEFQQDKKLHETKRSIAPVFVENTGPFLVGLSLQSLQDHHRHGKTAHAGQAAPEERPAKALP